MFTSKSLMLNALLFLLANSLFGQLTFSLPKTIDSNTTTFIKPVFVDAIDIDLDGDSDVLSISEEGKIAWFENRNGIRDFLEIQVFDDVKNNVSKTFMADMDGDDDEDLVLVLENGSRYNNKVIWMENTASKDNFKTEHTILDSIPMVHNIIASDIDSDGDFDILTHSTEDSSIYLYENSGNGEFGKSQIIIKFNGIISGFAVSDLDGDGDNDLVINPFSESFIVLYWNVDGKGLFSKETIISDDFDSPYCLRISDLDSDGDMDVIAFPSFKLNIVWLENIDGKGRFTHWKSLLTGSGSIMGNTLNIVDVDDDGDKDFIFSEITGEIAWFENLDGKAMFGKQKKLPYSSLNILYPKLPQACYWVNSTGPGTICVKDVDNDGDVDVIRGFKYANTVTLYINNGNGNFGEPELLPNSLYKPVFAFSADLDSDNDNDVIAINENRKIVWYENIDGKGTFSSQKIIMVDYFNLLPNVFDVDNESDSDIYSVFKNRTPFYWKIWSSWFGYVNQSSFIEGKKILTAGNLSPTDAADMDGDGDMDLIQSIRGKFVWYENVDGKGAFDEGKIITDFAKTSTSVIATDIDGDGDNDVVSSASVGKVAWYENLQGKGIFGKQRIITMYADGSNSLIAEDIDNDNDMDLLWVYEQRNTTAFINHYKTIVWVENINGKGKFRTHHIIDSTLKSLSSVTVIDLDKDGDKDVVAASPESGEIIWYENQIPAGTFCQKQIITNKAGSTNFVYYADINGDGKDDLLSVSKKENKIVWFENATSSNPDASESK